MLQKEQEEFEGTVHVNDDLPTEKDLKRVEDLLILDAQGKSRPFRELYDASGVAPRQLVIFIRHFFCGVSGANHWPAVGCFQVYVLMLHRTARNTSAPLLLR